MRWPDFRVPHDEADAADALVEAFARSAQQRVEIACAGGTGRTGTALACLAVMAGTAPEDAVAFVRDRYRPRAVETPGQRRYVRRFAQHPGVAQARTRYPAAVPSVFSRIISGELPARFVWQDDRCVGFLSINPLADGHVLVVSRHEVDHWIDADDELLAHLMSVCRVIGQALQQTFQRTKVGLTIVGLEVPHLHIHLVPIDSMGDLDFAAADPSPDPDHLDAVADRIRHTLHAMGRGGAAQG